LSDEIKFEADLTGARWKVSRMMGLPFLLRKRLTAWAAETTKMAKVNVRGKYLNVRTGQLWRNIAFKLVESSEGTVGVAIGTGPDVGTNPVAYASIHEHGGTITPKKGKYLTLPFPGVKGTVRNFGSFGKGGDLFVITSKKGNKIIAMRRWKKVRGGENYRQTQKFIPLFLLKKEVHIPARHWLSQTIDGQRMDLDRRMDPVTIIPEMLEGEAAFGD
jgi:phage gpG-like protein